MATRKMDTKTMKEPANRKEYLKALEGALKAKKDFKGLRYEQVVETGQEFMFITDLIGNTYFFDITGYSNEMVFRTVCLMEAGIKPEALILEIDKKREIAEMLI